MAYIGNMSCPELDGTEGYFYIIQTPDADKNVYKIGKTTQVDPNKRLCRYPQHSDVKYTVYVDNAHTFETIIMRRFKTVFKRRMEYGLEYYEGNIKDMICEAHLMWLKYNFPVEEKKVDKVKPNGWEYFMNEWLSKNQSTTVDKAYDAYVSIIRTHFMSNEYAEKKIFADYFDAVM